MYFPLQSVDGSLRVGYEVPMASWHVHQRLQCRLGHQVTARLSWRSIVNHQQPSTATPNPSKKHLLNIHAITKNHHLPSQSLLSPALSFASSSATMGAGKGKPTSLPGVMIADEELNKCDALDEQTIKVASKRESKTGPLKLKKAAPKHSKPGNWRDGSFVEGDFPGSRRGV